MTIAAGLLAIIADPAWLAMDATARGYHIQLLLVAAQRKPAGTLPGHEPTLRRYLGLANASSRPVASQTPSQVKALEKFLDGPHADLSSLLGAWWVASENAPVPQEGAHQIEVWHEHLWQTRWRPSLMEAWQLVDDELIEQMPHLAKAKGGYYCAVAEDLSRIGHGTTTAVIKPADKSAKKKAPEKSGGNLAGEEPGYDLTRWMDEKEVLSRWALPMDERGRRTLWEVAISSMCAADASATEKSRAKALLGKLIKQHGEEKVAEAVGSMSVRAVAPADAGSFLAALLRNKEEGSPAEQKARSQRAKVAL